MKAARNLLIAGGIYHTFEETAPALADLWRPHGIETEITFEVEDGLRRLAQGGYDLLTMHCLRWSMSQHPKYEPFRERWALSLTAEGRHAILDHVGRGGGLLGIHTASICFDDWREWGAVLGAGWVWGRSHHPPQAPLRVRTSSVPHPITQGLPPFSVADELYSDLDLAPGVSILAEARLEDGDAWQPVAMAQQVGSSRSAYLALGHDVASIEVPAHAEMLRRAGLWCAGRDANLGT
jgi:type 1 glutamine amidotransferase